MATLQKKTPKISIIILTYQTDNLTLNLLKSLENPKDIEILVVNNGENNLIEEEIKLNYPHVRYFFTGKNLGFSGGNNYGIKKAGGEWILLLNSDAITNTKQIEKLLNITEEEKYLVVTPKLVYKDGTTQNNVAYFDSLLKNSVNWLLARPRFLGCEKLVVNTKVDFATAAVLLIHNSVFKKIGLFDEERFFMYFEDLDFCYRLKKNKIPILYVSNVSIIHLEGASANKQPQEKNINYNKGLENYLEKNRGLFIALINKIFHLFR